MQTTGGFRLDDIPWEPAQPDGTRSATLAGDRRPGTLFTYAFAIPPGWWDRPHSHPAAAHLVVVRGELRLGFGNALAPEAARRYPAGSFLLVPAGAVHVDGAEEETVIIGTAVGPWSTDYARA